MLFHTGNQWVFQLFHFLSALGIVSLVNCNHLAATILHSFSWRLFVLKKVFYVFAFHSYIILVESSVCPFLPSLFSPPLSLPSSLFLSLISCVCCMYTGVWSFQSTHMCDPEKVSGILYYCPPSCSPATSFLTEPEASPSNPPVSPPYHSTGTTDAHGHAWLLK